jgi:hypothetical protein
MEELLGGFLLTLHGWLFVDGSMDGFLLTAPWMAFPTMFHGCFYRWLFMDGFFNGFLDGFIER